MIFEYCMKRMLFRMMVESVMGGRSYKVLKCLVNMGELFMEFIGILSIREGGIFLVGKFEFLRRGGFYRRTGLKYYWMWSI